MPTTAPRDSQSNVHPSTERHGTPAVCQARGFRRRRTRRWRHSFTGSLLQHFVPGTGDVDANQKQPCPPGAQFGGGQRGYVLAGPVSPFA